MAVFFDFVVDLTESLAVENVFNPSSLGAVYLFCVDFIEKAYDKIEEIDQQFGITVFYGKDDEVQHCCFTRNETLFTDHVVHFMQGFDKAKTGSGDTETAEDNLVGGMEYSCRKLQKAERDSDKIMIVLTDMTLPKKIELNEECPAQYVAILGGDISKNKQISIPLVNTKGKYDSQKNVCLYELADICDEEKRECVMNKIIDHIIEAIE